MKRNFIVVAPLPVYEHLQPCELVAYNGFGAPLALIANPEDLFFLTRSPTASVWMVPGAVS